MSIEYLPVGIACNLKCEYCYQDPMRDARNINAPIDWEAARKVLDKYNHNFTVFGGEPLLAPIEHLEEVWKWGFERFGANSIQTNAVLMTTAHMRLFAKYNVGVGISIDGPARLNGARCSEDDTMKVQIAIESLCPTRPPSIIVTLNRHNAVPERLPRLIQWLEWLEKIGVPHVNLHILEVEAGRESQALSDEENLVAFMELYRFSQTSKMKFNPFTDIRNLLVQENLKQVSCIWNACDALTTDAVQGVTPDGVQTNCGRTNKDGVNWVKGDKPGSERYLILHQVPQSAGGCKDCRFFVFCKGNCPGTAIDGDWRNRTSHCKVWYGLFEAVELEILREARLPISRDLVALRKLEHSFLDSAARRSGGSGNLHGDTHGDSPHGDSPHGDSYRSKGNGIAVTWKN